MKNRIRLRSVSTAVVIATASGILAAVPASAAVTCTSPVFKRQFFANTTFSGTPKKTDCDSVINQSWGTGAPAAGLPYNNFGVRWTVTRDFGSGGPFTLAAEARDGIRVYIDGVRKINLWRNVSTAVRTTVNVTVPSGKHTLRVDYVNWTGSADVKLTYAPRTSATVDKVQPLAPTGATAAYNASTLKATLTWAKNKEMDLAGYRVYRRLQGTSAYILAATTTGTSYTGAPPATGQIFYYEVRAYDKAGNTSTGSTDQPVRTADKTPPSRTVATVVMGTDRTRESFVVTWKPVADAAQYRVLRIVSGHSTWTEVARTTGTTLTDYVPATGSSVRYRVETYDAAGNVAPVQAGDEAYASAWWHPRATDVTASYQGNNTALLHWNQPQDTFALTWSMYRLNHSIGVPSSGEGTTPEQCRDLTYVTEGDHFRFSCLAAVTPGATNFFSVEPYHSESIRALPSATVSVVVPSAPAPATDFTGVADGRRVDLGWTGSTSGDVDHYEVHNGVWYPATSPGSEGRFYTYNQVDVPSDTTSIRWPWLYMQSMDFVLIAVKQDGTKLSAAQSPRVHLPDPAVG
ncbi:fibronectin type III domain-containing protein [Streptomyces sp. NPDC057136]|uniref:fibronectin type III domain-containing protein n=1 Tax=Streptomyces sp. NPDC057136 TaxID=3346029 RepID=UPI003643F4FD